MEENTAWKKKRAASAAAIEKQLKEIYRTEEDEEEAGAGAEKIEKISRRRWPFFVFAPLLLFAVAAAGWLGYSRFGHGIRYGNNVTVSIEGPAAPRSGEAAFWTVRYRNGDSLPLASASVALRLPPSLTVVSENPPLPDSGSLDWKIGALAPGAEGEISFQAKILDALDAPLAVQAVLSYRPANFNADFQKIGNWNSRIADSAVAVSLLGPDESVPGDQETFTVKLSRQDGLTGGASLPGLQIRFDPEEKLVIKNAAPNFSQQSPRTWAAEMPSGDPQTFMATASFAANAAGQTPVNVLVGTAEPDGSFMVLAKSSATVSVQAGDLALTVVRNGSAADGTANPGEALHVSVDYENKSSKPLSDIQISLTLSASPSIGGQSPLDWSAWNDIRRGAKSGNAVTWSKTQIPELASLAPGAKGSIDVEARIASDVFTTSDRNYYIDLSASGLIGSIGEKKSGKLVSTSVLHTAIATDARIAAAAGLVDQSQSPKAGATTTYRVVWALTNSLHEISGIQATAVLPAGVSWGGQGNVSAGTLEYDGTTRIVSWKLNRLPISIKSVSVDFMVNVTPQASDAGKTLPILSETDLTATDSATASQIASASPALTTATQDDPNGGIVKP